MYEHFQWWNKLSTEYCVNHVHLQWVYTFSICRLSVVPISWRIPCSWSIKVFLASGSLLWGDVVSNFSGMTCNSWGIDLKHVTLDMIQPQQKHTLQKGNTARYLPSITRFTFSSKVVFQLTVLYLHAIGNWILGSLIRKRVLYRMNCVHSPGINNSVTFDKCNWVCLWRPL